MATHCNTLQHIATHCNATHCNATHCNTLQYTAIHCNTLQHTATHCSTLPKCCNTLQHTATHWSTLQHTATHRNTTRRKKSISHFEVVWCAMCSVCRCRCLQKVTTHSYVCHGSFIQVSWHILMCVQVPMFAKSIARGVSEYSLVSLCFPIFSSPTLFLPLYICHVFTRINMYIL